MNMNLYINININKNINKNLNILLSQQTRARLHKGARNIRLNSDMQRKTTDTRTRHETATTPIALGHLWPGP